jgi:glucose/arabinose dehydrogenase
MYPQKKSSGHRFNSGLFYDSHRDILWGTEHGPRGGDELNKIESGYNYGWPNVSYGRNYNQKNKETWIQNSHENFKKPFFSWTPSIGISQGGVIKSQGRLFETWGKNDLIVSSLKNKSIYRLRVEDNKVFYSEKIYIGERIRSLIVLQDVILISTDEGSIITVQKSKVPIMTGAF